MITGARGQLGIESAFVLSSLGNIISLDHNRCDVSNQEAVSCTLQHYRPDLIVNCAAYTAVDEAENNLELAKAINSQGPQIIAQEALKIGSFIIHYSTDYVFDGRKKGFYTETDRPNPLNVYGKTKLAGDIALQNSGTRHVIFRTSWVFSQHGKNFLKSILELGYEKDKINVVSDQIGTPTSTKFIAETTLNFLRNGGAESQTSNLFNLTPRDKTNWYELSKYIMNRSMDMGRLNRLKSKNIKPITTKEYSAKASRPLNSLLSTDKLENKLKMNFPSWKKGVDDVLKELMID